MSLGQEHPDKVRRKRTAMGTLNPRFVKAVNAYEADKAFAKERAMMFKRLSKTQIAREYTAERIEALLAAAAQNLKALRGPTRMPGYLMETND